MATTSPASSAGASSLKMAGAAVLCVALVAFSSHSVHGRDGLLQTAYPVASAYAQPQMQQYAQPQMQQMQMQSAQARPMYPQQMMQQQYAQARPMYPQQMMQQQQMQQQPMVQGRPLMGLEEAPPAAPPAEGMMPPAEAMAPPMPGAAPGEMPGAPACGAAAQCMNAECANSMGCVSQEATGAVLCTCPGAPAPAPPPPPPPVAGSEAWLQEPDNALEAPGPEAGMAGANLAMYESGNVAVNLNKYLAYKAAREMADGEMDKLLLNDLKKAQPCEIVMEGGKAKCKAGTGVASGGWIPDEIFGFEMPWASSSEEGVQDSAMSAGQAQTLKANLEKVASSDRGISMGEKDAISQTEAEADQYTGR
jgi:hypothetical protein